MAQYNILKSSISDYIKTNTSQSISGDGLQQRILAAIDSLGKFYQFGGIVTPSSSFSAGDENVAFLGCTPGKYSAFGGFTLLDSEVALFLWNGSWTKQIVSYYANTDIYGVRHFYNNASPDLTRIGAADLHRDLPVQSLMRRCVVDDTGAVKYYLGATNSTLKEDGSAAKLDGTDGQVMVEIPAHYFRCTLNAAGSYMDVEISLKPFEGAILIPRNLISAYEAAVDRTDLKLCSIVNTDARYRGGNNTADWDGTYRSLLGMPATAISLTNFRTYAKNRGTGWGCYDYNMHKDLYWLFAIEYATLNSQKAFNAALDANGYHQGGLGPGVSNFSNWSAYNGYGPIIPCGFTNSLGNATGVKTFTLTDAQAAAYGSAHSESVPSYRGVENPFGHIFKWADGYLGVGDGDTQHDYVCRDRSKYASSINDGYELMGDDASNNGYVKSILPVSSAISQTKRVYGDIIPTDAGGGSSTYFCDYHYQSHASGTTYGLLVGGIANDGAYCGFAYLCADNAPSGTYAYYGSRLCWSAV